MASRPPDLPRLKERLDALRATWRGRRLDSDPLAFPHRFGNAGDREVVAFLAASLAFGRVRSIQTSVERVLAALGPSPTGFLDSWDERPIPELRPFVHRWVTGKDVEEFLRRVRGARQTYGSLGALFAEGDREGDFSEGKESRSGAPCAAGADYVPALSTFLRTLRGESLSGKAASRGLRFLLPSPSSGSACKRSHLFLRWMVRTDDFDLGLWTGGRFSPSRLLLPMDTHVHRISRYLGLTRRPAADLAAAREATAWLSRLSPEDPVSYDWALSRLGILAECVDAPARRHCERCAVAPVCRDRIGPLPAASPEKSLTT
ncbi:MAG TPA: TIGR02757 family protein [Thermoanaerobaculia bacterium]|nr:TIGR02757 family protein [Thermoanaerobaculia bacterium]